MQDLRSALDKADGKAPGPSHVETRLNKAHPAPVQWLFVHSYLAILHGAPPPKHWGDAHIWLSPEVPGSARLDDYRPIALGRLDMKLLTGSLTARASRRCSHDTEWSATGSRGPSPAPIPAPPFSWRSGSSSGEGPTSSSQRPLRPPRTALSTSSKKKCFSNALRHTLVVLEVLQAHRHFSLSIGPTKRGDNTF